MRARIAAALAASLLLGAAHRDPLEGRVAGKPQECITPSTSTGLVIADANTLTYTESGRRIWVTHPEGGCPNMRPLDTIVVERLSGSQLCRNDRFRTVSPGMAIPGPTCRIGAFTPYDKPKNR